MTKTPDNSEIRAWTDNLAKRAASAVARETLLESYYAGNRPAVRAAMVLELRCQARGCLLLCSWRMGGGLAAYRSGYKMSARLNAQESSAEGRASNTRDGDRHWKPHAFMLDDAREWAGHTIDLQCDHVRARIVTAEAIALADGAVSGRPVRRVLSGHEGTLIPSDSTG